MNKNHVVMGSMLILGLAVLLGFSACSQDKISTETGQAVQSTKNSKATFETQSADYHITVTVPSPPLKAQAETYTLTVHDLKANKPIEQIPNVTVEMPMGNTPMKAPTTLSKGGNPGEFQVETEFTMAGDWILNVKPTPSSEAISLTLPVQ